MNKEEQIRILLHSEQYTEEQLAEIEAIKNEAKAGCPDFEEYIKSLT